MPFVRRGDIGLYYESYGSGQPPLVFVHGWCCDHTFFQPQLNHFRASHAVVTLDLRGCGRSDRPEDGYDIPTYADDVAFLCGELGLADVVVVGHSSGALIGIELAARHPSLVGRVVAVDPGPIDPLPHVRHEFDALATHAEGPDGESVRLATIEASFLPTDDPERRRRIVETMASVPLPVAVASFRAVTAWNGVGALMTCRAPLLVLLSDTGGSNDPARLRALKPDVQIGVTVGAGHFHQLEVPEQVTPMIEKFLAVTSRASPELPVEPDSPVDA